MSPGKQSSDKTVPIAIEDELSPQQLETYSKGKNYKEGGDKAFKENKPLEALKKYHMALLHFRGLTRTNPTIPQANTEWKSKIDDEAAKVYSNMSACHLKLGNYERTIETADKALASSVNNKALFRKAKALGELGYMEKAIAILEELATKKLPEHQMVEATLLEMKAKNARLEKESREKMRGFLKKNRAIFPSENGTSEIPQGSAPDADSKLEPLASGSEEQSSIVEVPDS